MDRAGQEIRSLQFSGDVQRHNFPQPKTSAQLRGQSSFSHVFPLSSHSGVALLISDFPQIAGGSLEGLLEALGSMGLTEGVRLLQRLETFDKLQSAGNNTQYE